MPTDVRYHKSSENIDDEERATIKPLSASYRRFTVLERVLMVAVFVFIVLAIVFGILYAGSETSERRDEKNGMTGNI
jgi:cell division protein FtsL